MKIKKDSSFNKTYWNNFYKSPHKNQESNFAHFCFEKIQHLKSLSLIDLGCGNGRDSIFFNSKKIPILGLDLSEITIEKLNNLSLDNSRFISCDFAKIENITKEINDFTKNMTKVFYSRFSIHCLNQDTQNILFEWIKKNMNENDLFFIESRTTKDELFKVGIESEEGYFTDHYRRFIDYEKFHSYANNMGFRVDFQTTGKGFAKYKNEDPEVMRLILELK